jgi:hypothetical protein
MRRLNCTYDELGEMPEWLVARASLWFAVVDEYRDSQRKD